MIGGQRIGGFTIDSIQREARMRRWEFERIKKTVEDKLEKEVNEAKRKFTLNTIHCIECCKTCSHKKLYGQHGNANGSSTTFHGCEELGIRIKDEWHCGLWSCSEQYTPYNLQGPDPNIVAETLYVKQQKNKDNLD